MNKPTEEQEEQAILEKLQTAETKAASKTHRDAIVVEGVNNLMTNLARCCQPIPGDDISGYVTQGRGISVHRADCEQLAELRHHAPERIIDAVWGAGYKGAHNITVRVTAMDRTGLLKDITTVLSNDKVKVQGMQNRIDAKQQLNVMDFELELNDLDTLAKVLSHLENVRDVTEPNG